MMQMDPKIVWRWIIQIPYKRANGKTLAVWINQNLFASGKHFVKASSGRTIMAIVIDTLTLLINQPLQVIIIINIYMNASGNFSGN